MTRSDYYATLDQVQDFLIQLEIDAAEPDPWAQLKDAFGPEAALREFQEEAFFGDEAQLIC